MSPTQIVALVTTTKGPLELGLQTGPDGLIVGLTFKPPPRAVAAPSSWTEFDQRLRKVAPKTSMLTAKIAANGQCQPVHAVDAGDARPLGSMFKLDMLAAVAQRISDGKLKWEDEPSITADLKSLPLDDLQNRPDGTVTVRAATLKMISISDNTAADLLAHRVGRTAVVAAQKQLGSKQSARNDPFLRTRELFVLKGSQYPKLRDVYLSNTPIDRLMYLDSTVAGVPVPRSPHGPRPATSARWSGSRPPTTSAAPTAASTSLQQSPP